jgi:ubiquinone/menaquinone biosynthesis C-methylase UbiE
MVEVARRRGTELGLGNVDYRVIDAERIELDSGSVDGVFCQSTYMLAAGPAAALAETRRVLRPRGRLQGIESDRERRPAQRHKNGDPGRDPPGSHAAIIALRRGVTTVLAPTATQC